MLKISAVYLIGNPKRVTLSASISENPVPLCQKSKYRNVWTYRRSHQKFNLFDLLLLISRCLYPLLISVAYKTYWVLQGLLYTEYIAVWKLYGLAGRQSQSMFLPCCLLFSVLLQKFANYFLLGCDSATFGWAWKTNSFWIMIWVSTYPTLRMCMYCISQKMC